MLGVNIPTGGTNALMYAGKRTSWIRDTSVLKIQESWGAAYRDVVVLDANNRTVGVINVTINDLRVEANKTAMKNLIISAASPADTDNDKLPDYWETNTYGNLSRTPASLEPGGIKVLQRWAHGASGVVDVEPSIVALPDGSVSMIYTRRRGTALGLTVVPEFSEALASWGPDGQGWEEWTVRTRYDGSGCETVEWKILSPGPRRFVRVKAQL